MYLCLSNPLFSYFWGLFSNVSPQSFVFYKNFNIMECTINKVITDYIYYTGVAESADSFYILIILKSIAAGDDISKYSLSFGNLVQIHKYPTS
jgi:hypothetical protein